MIRIIGKREKRTPAAYEQKEYDETGDIGKHPTERDLKGPEQFVRRHDVRRSGETQDVGHGEQDLGDNHRIARQPREATYSAVAAATKNDNNVTQVFVALTVLEL